VLVHLAHQVLQAQLVLRETLVLLDLQALQERMDHPVLQEFKDLRETKVVKVNKESLVHAVDEEKMDLKVTWV